MLSLQNFDAIVLLLIPRSEDSPLHFSFNSLRISMSSNPNLPFYFSGWLLGCLPPPLPFFHFYIFAFCYSWLRINFGFYPTTFIPFLSPPPPQCLVLILILSVFCSDPQTKSFLSNQSRSSNLYLLIFQCKNAFHKTAQTLSYPPPFAKTRPNECLFCFPSILPLLHRTNPPISCATLM